MPEKELQTPCSQICLIAPSDVLGHKAREIIGQMGEDIDVYVSMLDDAEAMAASLIERGAKVFISRKGTKILIEEKFKVAVAGIPSILSDYMDAMKKAREIPGLIAFFSYDDLSEDVKTMCGMLDITYRCYHFTGSQSALKSVRQAVEDGAVLGIGGVVTEIPAGKLGLPYISMESSNESIISAIETAKQILFIQKQNEIKRENLKISLERHQAVINFSRDGILAVDADGCVNVANPAAEKLLGISAGRMMGRPIAGIIPDSRLLGALRSGQKRLDEVMRFNKKYLTVNAIPIIVDGRKKGAVAILQDVKSLQKSEQKVRIGLHKKELVAKYYFDDIIRESEIMNRVVMKAEQFAPADATVLITGETGTGKELFAQSIHNAGKRRDGPFVAINCASLDKNLMESELFGYEEGTFTGALKGGKAGLFEMAHGGTIFLDEIGEIPFNVQAQLLRVLQEREVRRIGSSTVIPVDVRVIVATNRNLLEEIRRGNFRQDLFYRLNILNLHIPPLRERGEDVRLIARSMFRSRLPEPEYTAVRERLEQVMDHMRNHTWPGNVRELANFVECISVLSASPYGETEEYMDGILCRESAPDNGVYKERLAEDARKDRKGGTEGQEPADREADSSADLRNWEKQLIEDTLKANHLSTGRTAAQLGMSRSKLWRKMKEYGITK